MSNGGRRRPRLNGGGSSGSTETTQGDSSDGDDTAETTGGDDYTSGAPGVNPSPGYGSNDTRNETYDDGSSGGSDSGQQSGDGSEGDYTSGTPGVNPSPGYGSDDTRNETYDEAGGESNTEQQSSTDRGEDYTAGAPGVNPSPGYGSNDTRNVTGNDPQLPEEVDPTSGDAPPQRAGSVTITDEEEIREQLASEHDEIDESEVSFTTYQGEPAVRISDPQFDSTPISLSGIESSIQDEYNLDPDELDVRETEEGELQFAASPVDLFASERIQFADEAGVDPANVVVEQTSSGVEFDVVGGEQREMAAEQYQSQRQEVAQEMGVDPDELDVREGEGGQVVFEPTEAAQREQLRERIEAEEPGAENIEFEETEDGIRATYEVDDSPGIDDVIGGVQDPIGAAQSIGGSVAENLDPRDNEAAAVAGAAVATPEPASTAAGAVALGGLATLAVGREVTGEGEPAEETVTASAQSSTFVNEIETPSSREEFEVVEVPVDEVAVEERTEITTPERPASQEDASEIETPEERSPPSEIETPERPDEVEQITEVPVIDQAELVSEYRDDVREEDADTIIEEQTVVSNDEMVHPEEMRRRLEGGESEQDFEEIDGEEVITITSEDLVDPEELHQEREDELAEQLEAHEEYLQEQEEGAATDESGETEDIDDELQPLQERDEDEFDGRSGELFTFIGGTELEVEDELELEEVSEEQLSLLEEAQSTGVEAGSEQLLPPAGEVDTETPTEGVNERAQETAVDQMLEEIAMQEQAFESEFATDLATETATAEVNALVNEFAAEEGYGTQQGFGLPSLPDMGGSGDTATSSGGDGDARFMWDVRESRGLDIDVSFEGVGDLDDF